MNHLAHLYLSQSDPDWMVGNFIADFIKGRAMEKLPEKIQEGVRMHRFIDGFMDNHVQVVKAKKRLYPFYGKYAAVIIDMYYDHILASNWKDFSPLSLDSFAHASYKMLQSRRSVLPERSLATLDHMQAYNWLGSYAQLEGMQKAFNGLSRRARFDSKMEQATQQLEEDYALLKKEFLIYLPELLSALQKQFGPF